jgi:uncharacterized protein (DUF1697 family)
MAAAPEGCNSPLAQSRSAKWASPTLPSSPQRRLLDVGAHCLDTANMTIHIGLLRAVNVGGSGRLAMSDLREVMTELDFSDVRTLLQSGNVVFRGNRASGAALEGKLTTAVRERLGVSTEFFVRTAKEWDALIGANPYPEAASSDPGHLVIMALKDEPTAKAVAALRSAITGPETVEALGRHLYIVYPAGIGRSRLTNALIESKLGTRGTGRNWNTVLKLAALTRA